MTTQQNPSTSGRPGLGCVDIEIDSAETTTRTDPNGLLMMAFGGELLKLKPMPSARSLISGKPAVVYATDEVTVPLSPEEVNRLALRSLRPDEFLSLLAVTGVFHELHDDFYDEQTGEALQPQDSGYEPVPIRRDDDALG